MKGAFWMKLFYNVAGFIQNCAKSQNLFRNIFMHHYPGKTQLNKFFVKNSFLQKTLIKFAAKLVSQNKFCKFFLSFAKFCPLTPKKSTEKSITYL